MDSLELKNEEIRKSESVGFIYSSLKLFQADLFLTRDRLVLKLKKGNFRLFGNLFRFGKKGFNLMLEDIVRIEQGVNGWQRNVLEITDKANNKYRLMVRRYLDWENALKPAIS